MINLKDSPFIRYGKLCKLVKNLIWLDENNYLITVCKNKKLDYKEVSDFLKISKMIIEEGNFSILEDILKEKENLENSLADLDLNLITS